MPSKYLHILLMVLCLIKVEIAFPLKGKAGPYKVTLLSVRRCARHKVAYENNPSASLFMETYNDTNGVPLMRGNFSILKSTSKWKATAKQFLLVNGKWKSSLVLHSSGCQGILTKIFVTTMGADLDYNNCTIKLGDYVFKDLDVNKIVHLWTPTQIYGREMWRNEVTSPAGLVDCWEFIDVVEPV